ARARDREQPLPVGRCARVEALVADEVAAEVLAPDLVAGVAVQSPDRAGVRGDEDAVAEDGRARVDTATSVVRPPDPARPHVAAEEPTVRCTEVDEAADGDRRGLH